MLDSQRELMAAALKYLGYSVNDADEKHWKQAADLIVRAKPYWAAFSNTSYVKELAIGNLWVAHGYSNDMFQAALDAKKTGRGFTIGYSTPKEGAVSGARQHGIASKREAVPILPINSLISCWKERIRPNSPISSAPAIPTLMRCSISSPKSRATRRYFRSRELLARLEMLRDLDRKQRRLLSRLWTEIKLR